MLYYYCFKFYFSFFLCFLLFVTAGLLHAENVSSVDSLELSIPTTSKHSICGTLEFGSGSTKSQLIIIISSPIGTSRIQREGYHGSRGTNLNYLADQLNLAGYSVFRFDSRGVGKSTGTNDGLTLYQHADDVESICRYFKRHYFKPDVRISLVGLSEGGAAATVVASRFPHIASLILLSTPGTKDRNFNQFQFEQHFRRVSSMLKMPSFVDSLEKKYTRIYKQLADTIFKYQANDSIVSAIESYVAEMDTNEMIVYEKQILLNSWTDPQQIALRKYNPDMYLSKVTCPVLAMNGTKDDYIECHSNLAAIRDALIKSGNKRVEIEVLENVDHFYYTYGYVSGENWDLIDRNEKFSEIAIEKLKDWFKSID